MNSRRNSLRCRVLTDASALPTLEADWRRLFQEASYPTPFASWEWAHTWWQNFQPASSCGSTLSPLILAVYAPQAQGEELIGLAPCYYRSTPEPSGRPRVLRLFGDLGEHGDSLTEERVVLLKRGCEREATRALLGYLSRISATGDWDAYCLRFPCLGPREEMVLPASQVHRPLPRETIPTEMLDLPSSWETYRSSLSKSMRDNLAYYPRLLSRRGYDWTIRTVTQPTEMPAAIDHLVNLHRMRAESTRGIPHADHLAAVLNRDCMQQCLLALSTERMVRILLLEVGDRSVGALTMLVSDRMETVYYTGFDPAFYDFSPLTILNAEAIRSAITRGVSHINFLAGTARWNARWGAVTRTHLQQMQGVKRHPRSAWNVAMHLIGHEGFRGTLSDPFPS